MIVLWYIFFKFSDRICNFYEIIKCILIILKWNVMFKEDLIYNKYR